MILSITQFGCSALGIRTAETAKYQVVLSDGDKEIRRYPSYIVAKTTVKGDFEKAQGKAFRTLAGYIFGDNARREKVSMTAPVVQTQEPASEKIAMTAPVVQAPAGSGCDDEWVMTFMMPSRYRLEDLPTPNGTAVRLEPVSGEER